MNASSRVADERRILIAGGGTAGHVNPALAVAAALQRRFPRLNACWVGSNRIEAELVPAAGVAFRRIDIRFSYRTFTPANIPYYRRHILPILGGKPFRQALVVVDDWRPHLVLATGGYVAAPVIWAAQRRTIPVALIEINNPPGRVNWEFAPGAWRVYSANSDIAAGFVTRCAAGKVRTLGYPAQVPQRSRARVCSDHGIDPRRRILLAMGGSLGSGAIHGAVRELLFAASRSRDQRWQDLAVLNVAGERPALRDDLASTDVLPAGPAQYCTVDYLPDAISALAASHFYIGRSGAATVGELIASGVPALLIPDPQHVDQQQLGNAQVLVRRGQGHVLPQDEVSGAAVLDWLKLVWDSPRVEPPSPPAADAIADDLLNAWEEPCA